jgi:cell division protein FtsI (penicillin-binding protein 3)
VNMFNGNDSDVSTTPSKRPLVSRGRASLVHASLVLFAFALIARAVQVQLIDGKTWAAKAARQQVSVSPLPAARGQILDERGNVLVESREVVQLSIAPNEVRRNARKNQDDGPKLAKGLQALGVSRQLVRNALDVNQKWVVIPKMVPARDAAPILALKSGIHPTFAMQRVNAAPEGVKKLIGVIDNNGEPVGGIEQSLDSLLRGQSGKRTGVRDGGGNVWESPALSGVDAKPGHSIALTINATLQEICERELAQAVARTGSTGGDVVIVDPRDGAILAVAGLRDHKTPLSATPLAEGYEPGSVLKPFLVARLIDRKMITPDDIVNTENGRYTINKRTITDEHIRPSMSVRDVIRFSSNIGIVKLASKFTAGEEYQLLRDFGFGVQPGTPYPAESRGRVPLPRTWSAQTSASMAMGYEMLATPVQLAEAYATVANGGELLQPGLIREIRDANGTIVYKHQRQVLRRVMSPETAEKMRVILESVVDSGTATAADLKTFDVAGKTGTARRAEGGVYRAGNINATFAAMFPAKHPQYVIIAKLIDPKGQVFGGLVAAPLVNKILQSAVASHDVGLDGDALTRDAHIPPPKIDSAALRRAAAATRLALLNNKSVAPLLELDTGILAVNVAPTAKIPAPTTVVVALPFTPKLGHAPPGDEKLVPNVRGLDLRDAVRTLQGAGFQVRLIAGTTGKTRPLAGSLAKPGTIVVLETSR